MLVASVDVKESIMSMELMQDKQHETTALLVNDTTVTLTLKNITISNQEHLFIYLLQFCKF